MSHVRVPDTGCGGRFHCWAGVPLQGQICSWVPGAVLAFGSSRQSPVALFTSVFPDCVQTWLEAPSHIVMLTSRPPSDEVPPPVSMHIPRTEMLPFVTISQFWFWLPLQVLIATIWLDDVIWLLAP